MIEHINANFKKHIITLEDPSSTFLKTTNRWSNSASWALTRFHSITRSSTCLRQDPDIIMIGEMRDASALPPP